MGVVWVVDEVKVLVEDQHGLSILVAVQQLLLAVLQDGQRQLEDHLTNTPSNHNLSSIKTTNCHPSIPQNLSINTTKLSSINTLFNPVIC